MRAIPHHFPHNLSAYVMAGPDALPNAQLVLRRINYQETAEYRVFDEANGTSRTTTGSSALAAPLNARPPPARQSPAVDEHDENSSVA